MVSSLRLASDIVGETVRRMPQVYGEYRRLIEHADGLDADGRAALQERLLLPVMRAARSAAAYRDGQPHALADVPVLSKAELRERPEDHRTRRLVPVSRSHTSGTTGVSMQVARSLSNIVFEQAAIDWTVAKAGFDFRRSRIAVFRASNIKNPDDRSPPFWQASAGGRVLTFSSNHVSAASFGAIAGALEAFAPTILYAYPSAAEHLQQLYAASGRKLHVPLVLTSSETLTTEARSRLADTFGAVTVDYYGQAERVAFAYSLEPGAYRFMPAYGVVEFRPIDQDGEPAVEIIGTGLHNRAQLLLRYRTGDVIGGTVAANDLPAVALGTATFPGVAGRINEVIHGPNGELFIGINHIPRGLERLGRFQFLQSAPERVTINVSARTEDADADTAAILANARRKIPAGVHLDIRFGAEPYRIASGKAPFVVKLYDG